MGLRILRKLMLTSLEKTRPSVICRVTYSYLVLAFLTPKVTPAKETSSAPMRASVS